MLLNNKKFQSISALKFHLNITILNFARNLSKLLDAVDAMLLFGIAINWLCKQCMLQNPDPDLKIMHEFLGTSYRSQIIFFDVKELKVIN